MDTIAWRRQTRETVISMSQSRHDRADSWHFLPIIQVGGQGGFEKGSNEIRKCRGSEWRVGTEEQGVPNLGTLTRFPETMSDRPRKGESCPSEGRRGCGNDALRERSGRERRGNKREKRRASQGHGAKKRLHSTNIVLSHLDSGDGSSGGRRQAPLSEHDVKVLGPRCPRALLRGMLSGLAVSAL
jgi:hypothetical protein